MVLSRLHVFLITQISLISFSMNNDSEDELEKEEGTEWIHLYTPTSKAKINNLIYAVLLRDYII